LLSLSGCDGAFTASLSVGVGGGTAALLRRPHSELPLFGQGGRYLGNESGAGIPSIDRPTRTKTASLHGNVNRTGGVNQILLAAT